MWRSEVVVTVTPWYKYVELRTVEVPSFSSHYCCWFIVHFNANSLCMFMCCVCVCVCAVSTWSCPVSFTDSSHCCWKSHPFTRNFYAFDTQHCRQRHYVFGLSLHLFVHSSRQMLLPQHLMNGTSNLNETYTEYSPVLAYDLFSFWRSEVKGQGHSRPSRWRRHPRQRWGVEIPSSHFLIFYWSWWVRSIFTIFVLCSEEDDINDYVVCPLPAILSFKRPTHGTLKKQ